MKPSEVFKNLRNIKSPKAKAIYGFDISSVRADDLDKKMIEYILGKKSPSVLDVACGAGGQSVRLAVAGAMVTAVDSYNHANIFKNLRLVNSLSEETLMFVQGDMSKLTNLLGAAQFEVCCMQRAIHYLPYSTALKTLKTLRQIVKYRLYISVSGLGTKIGTSYQDKEKPVEQRFCGLDDVSAEIFNIHEPLCLYTQKEFEQLLQNAGWEVKESWVSTFGNIKVVCQR